MYVCTCMYLSSGLSDAGHQLGYDVVLVGHVSVQPLIHLHQLSIHLSHLHTRIHTHSDTQQL